MEKKCTKCGITQAIDQFTKQFQTVDGLSSHCKTCKHNYYLANRKQLLDKVPCPDCNTKVCSYYVNKCKHRYNAIPINSI